jgi:hypothetical protein
MTGKFEGGGGFTASVGQENERPNLIRQTFTLQGMTAMQAYDGTTGWQIQPFGGKKDPELMGEDELRDLLLDADLTGRWRITKKRAARSSIWDTMWWMATTRCG